MFYKKNLHTACKTIYIVFLIRILVTHRDGNKKTPIMHKQSVLNPMKTFCSLLSALYIFPSQTIFSGAMLRLYHAKNYYILLEKTKW